MLGVVVSNNHDVMAVQKFFFAICQKHKQHSIVAMQQLHADVGAAYDIYVYIQYIVYIWALIASQPALFG